MFIKLLAARLRNSKPRFPLVKQRKTLIGSGVKAPSVEEAMPFSQVPGPKGIPYFGTLHHYMKAGGISKIFQIEQNFYQEYGPIFKEKIFGATIVHVMDPAECEKVYRAEGIQPSRGVMGTSWLTYRKKKGYCLGVNLRYSVVCKIQTLGKRD